MKRVGCWISKPCLRVRWPTSNDGTGFSVAFGFRPNSSRHHFLRWMTSKCGMPQQR